ncbi:MAG: DUF3368 domain-containing protein [Methanocellales archaeon]|nr:DUF3368 domain-containing protein [Methanocellales archaeon]MDI6903240.1 DUF3368 domain-containing protein [Methanocellales archaeon]
MILVFDSTPLIYLSKVGLSWIFRELSGEILIPKTVFEEMVTEGKKRGDADAFVVDELVKDKILSVVDAGNEFKRKFEGLSAELHPGEIDVLALASAKGAIAIFDESIAREVGDILGIKTHGTFYLIFSMVKKGKLSRKEAKNKVDEMVKKGWRIGHERYLEFMELLERIEE